MYSKILVAVIRAGSADPFTERGIVNLMNICMSLSG